MIIEFFSNYKNLEKQTTLIPTAENGWKGADEAKALAQDTHRVFIEKVEAGLAQKRS